MARRRIDPEGLNSLPLGWVASEGRFRLLAPKATQVWLLQRTHPENPKGERVLAGNCQAQGTS